MRRFNLSIVLLLLSAVAIVCFDRSATDAAAPPTPFAVSGVDLHDGEIEHFGSTYYLYGTEYDCGFTWRSSDTPWCGFGVATSTDLTHWSAITTIVHPTDPDPFTGHSWNYECGGHSGQIAAGCFNPRMIQRSGWGPNDGVFILWFNSPEDFVRNESNAYDALGCDGPAGPCGVGYPPYGTTHKPRLPHCGGNGDFTLVPQPAAPPVIICTNANQTLSQDQLNAWGTDGAGPGASNLAGLTGVEAPGAYFDSAAGRWVLTYADPDCGYCRATPTGYALANSLAGPWTAPANAGVAAPQSARRDISASSCGGQARTVSLIDGTPYEGVDLWTGSLNERNAGLAFVPLFWTGSSGAPGTVWEPITFVCP